MARRALSANYMRRVARLALPFIGAPVDKSTLDRIAKETLTDVLYLRAEYRRLAARAYGHQMRKEAPSLEDLPGLANYRYSDWRKAVGKALQEGAADDATVIDRRAVSRMLVRMDLHGRNAERNTMVALSIQDGGVIGWARYDPEMPPTCPLCRLTISRGPVYTSAEAAGSEGNDYHAGCTCAIALVKRGEEHSWPGYEQFLSERELYKTVANRRDRDAAYRRLVAEQNGVQFANSPGRSKSAADKAAGIKKES